MVLVPSNLTVSSTSSQQSSVNLNRLFALGQVLTAKIQPISHEQVKITVGNQNLIANTKQPIMESGTVQLKVKQVVPELQLSLVSNNKSTANQNNPAQTLQAAYRQFIPSQAPLSNSFQQISLLQSLPPSLQAPVSQLLNLVSKQETQNITGKDLKERLANSGLFLESKLKNNAPQSSIKQDIKAQLLQLQQSTDRAQLSQQSSALSKLSHVLNQAISRITVQQIQLYENPFITPLVLLDEKDKTITEDYIEIHKRQQEDDSIWEVFIELSLPNSKLAAKITLTEEDQLSCYLWCEDTELHQEISNKLPELRNLLDSNELNQVSLQMSQQKPQKPTQSIKVALIDIKV